MCFKNKSSLLIVPVFIAGLILGIKIDYSPSYEQSRFIEQCGELNGKEFSVSNVSPLFGNCYVDCSKNRDHSCGTIEKCTEKHVNEFMKDYAKSAIDEYGFNKSFHISQKGLKNSWKCIINTTVSGMKAKALFVFD